jgi:hypothetical protein
VKLPRYTSSGVTVLDHHPDSTPVVCQCTSIRLAKRIARALNLYRPKVRRRKKSAEKAVESR